MALRNLFGLSQQRLEITVKHPLAHEESRFRMTLGYRLPHAAWVLLAAGTTSVPALAQGTAGEAQVSLGLDPASPQAQTLPGGTVPAFGAPSADERDWRFDYHGIFTAPLRAGINTRDNPREGQSDTVLHAPPVVPDDHETFSHTGVVPIPYAQLNLSYGNSVVTGTVSIVAKVPSVAAGFFDPSAQLGVNDLFLTLNLPNIGKDMLFRVNVGAFTNRYGGMGEYDEGHYSTPVIARINGLGENIAATFALGDITLLIEQGFVGQANKASSAIEPAGWNGFADPRAGSSFANHLHGGLGLYGLATVGVHYITAWTQDDRANPSQDQPDGSINVLAADLRLSMKRFGHLYAAAAYTEAEESISVGRVIEILNTPGGPGLEQNYLGNASRGNGELMTFAAEYKLSLGRLVSHPVPFTGGGPDIVLMAFGMQTQVTSDDPRYDDVTKRKYGVEGTYSLLPWLAASMRYDRVDPDVDDERYSFAVLSPRLIFRTGWQARDQVVLGYSRWLNGSLTTVRTGYPPREDVTVIPDEHMLSLSASMWW